jgi:predicted GNAT superfamily acetyltransferase
MTKSAFNATAQAARVSDAAALRAGVVVSEVEDMVDMRAVSALFEQVWGRGDEGVPFNSEVLRSLVHAGGAVTVARNGTGSLAGAAVLSLAPDAGTYSFIAAAAAGSSNRGIGYALKLRQRFWALSRGRSSMTWTFDPLVSRNGRFNLTKLGATAEVYLPCFYGRMTDGINGDDDADRLVAHWRLDDGSALAATEGTAADPREPDPAAATLLAHGPDGEPSLMRDGVGDTWVRVPGDIVALRRTDADAAAEWRSATRAAFTTALADGAAATGVSRNGWYRITAVQEGQA